MKKESKSRRTIDEELVNDTFFWFDYSVQPRFSGLRIRFSGSFSKGKFGPVALESRGILEGFLEHLLLSGMKVPR